MVLFPAKKWSCLLLALYLAFAMIGAFTFSVIESLDIDSLGEDRPVSGGSIDIANWLAEGQTFISRAGRYSFSPRRGAFLRITAPAAAHKTGALFFQSSPQITGKLNYPVIKNAIPLKLRI